MLFDSYTVALCSFPLLQLFVTKRASPCAAVADGVSIYAFHIYAIFASANSQTTNQNEMSIVNLVPTLTPSPICSHSHSTLLYSTALLHSIVVWREKRLKCSSIWFSCMISYMSIYSTYNTHTHAHTHTHDNARQVAVRSKEQPEPSYYLHCYQHVTGKVIQVIQVITAHCM